MWQVWWRRQAIYKHLQDTTSIGKDCPEGARVEQGQFQTGKRCQEKNSIREVRGKCQDIALAQSQAQHCRCCPNDGGREGKKKEKGQKVGISGHLAWSHQSWGDSYQKGTQCQK